MQNYFHPSNKELVRTYGYADRSCDLDLTFVRWEQQADLDWSRPFEIACTILEGPELPPTQDSGCMSASEAEFFTNGARAGFKYIGRRHNLTPVQAWAKIEHGMQLLGIHIDDLEHVQAFMFGWTELTPEQLHRWALRYPKRCPLLDAMCSLDSTCEQLNQTQDWLLHAKGSYGRTRSDVLPALPDPDGVRPVIKATTTRKENSWGVMTQTS